MSIFTGACPVFFSCELWLLNNIDPSSYFVFDKLGKFLDDGEM
jgi:hypothetical protein